MTTIRARQPVAVDQVRVTYTPSSTTAGLHNVFQKEVLRKLEEHSQQLGNQRQQLDSQVQQLDSQLQQLKVQHVALNAQSSDAGRAAVTSLMNILSPLLDNLKSVEANPAARDKYLDASFSLISKYYEERKKLSEAVKVAYAACNKPSPQLTEISICEDNVRTQVKQLLAINKQLKTAPQHPCSLQLDEVSKYIDANPRPSTTGDGERWDKLIKYYNLAKSKIEAPTIRTKQLKEESERIDKNILESKEKEVRGLLETIVVIKRRLQGAVANNSTVVNLSNSTMRVTR